MKVPESGRIFTKQEADKLLPRVMEMTKICEEQISELQRSVDLGEVSSEQKREVMNQIDNKVNNWAQNVTSLGIHAKGLWLVDFDSGDGFYYCWKLGEDELSFMHGYGETFADRRPVWRRDREDELLNE